MLIQLLIDLGRPGDLVSKYWLAKRANTQARMTELYACSAEGLLAFRLQICVKARLTAPLRDIFPVGIHKLNWIKTGQVMCCCLLFSFGMPVLFLLIGLYGWLAQWIDRILFLRLLLPPPPTHGRLMVYILRIFLPVAIVGHSWFSLIMFSAICNDNDSAEVAACRDSTWTSAKIILAVSAVLTTLTVAYFWSGETKRRRLERAQQRSQGDVPLVLFSQTRVRQIYRFFAQKDMRVRPQDPDDLITARVRPGESKRDETSNRSVRVGGVPLSLASADAHANDHDGLEDESNGAGCGGRDDGAPTPAEAGADADILEPLLLPEHTLMYLPPLTRLILHSFRKAVANRGVEAYLQLQPDVREAIDEAPLPPPSSFASLKTWARRNSGQDLRRRGGADDGEEVVDDDGDDAPTRLLSLSALRLPNASNFVDAASASRQRLADAAQRLPSAPKPSLLLQLDAIERALGRHQKRDAAQPAADGGLATDGPPGEDPPDGGNGAAESGRSDLSAMQDMEEAELAEAAQRLVEAAQRAQSMLAQRKSVRLSRYCSHASDGSHSSGGGDSPGARPAAAASPPRAVQLL